MRVCNRAFLCLHKCVIICVHFNARLCVEKVTPKRKHMKINKTIKTAINSVAITKANQQKKQVNNYNPF